MRVIMNDVLREFHRISTSQDTDAIEFRRRFREGCISDERFNWYIAQNITPAKEAA